MTNEALNWGATIEDMMELLEVTEVEKEEV